MVGRYPVLRTPEWCHLEAERGPAVVLWGSGASGLGWCASHLKLGASVSHAVASVFEPIASLFDGIASL